MTLAVLGLDAADYDLLQRWDCTNILLDNHRALETDTYSLDVPATLEVWPSIATGLQPTEHGVTVDPTERQTRSFARRVVSGGMQSLPDGIQSYILEVKENIAGSTLPVTDQPHVFDSGSVSNWPGITPCYDWQRGIEWFNAVVDGEMSESEFQRLELGNAGKGIGWLRSQALTDTPITGRHVHALDTMGHIYGSREQELASAYQHVNELVAELTSNVDELVIVSDHGMQSTALNDPEPGVHSKRALISTTLSGELPDSIYGIQDWLVENLEEASGNRNSRTDVDAPREHLEDLGYLE